jgi:hypothetical protein
MFMGIIGPDFGFEWSLVVFMKYSQGETIEKFPLII